MSAAAVMRRACGGALGLALAIAVAAGAPARGAASPLPALRAVAGPGAAIEDADGRQVLLRGINVNQLNDYFQADPAQPVSFPLTEQDFAGIARLGFDSVRLTVNWSSLEPRRGAFDEAYLGRIRTAVGWARAHDLYVVLDMHQDAWGKFVATPPGSACPPGLGPAVGWDGAPEWATLTDGLTTCRAGDTRELSPAVARAFESFYADRDGIQAELVRTWGRLAGAFASDPTVAGYDLFNEPHPGFLVGVNEGAPLGRFYARAIEAIRAAERAAPGGFARPVFFEPSVLWSGAAADTLPPPGFTTDPQIVFAPHLYAESITLDRKVGTTATSIEQGFANAEAAAAAYRAPLWSGEWGWFGKPAEDLPELERYARAEDRARIGGAWWVWRQACGDPHQVGYPGASGSLNRYDCPGDRPLGLTAEFTRVLSRAYPRFAPGRLTALRSDPGSGSFALAGRAGNGSCRLDAWVPDLGRGEPSLRGEGLSELAVRSVPGGFRVTACARGSYTLTGEPSGVAAPGKRARGRCRSRRVFSIRLRGLPAGTRLRTVVVRVGRGRARTLRGDRRRVRIDLRGRRAGRVVVTLALRARGGRRFAERRVYRTCVPARRG